MSYVMDISTCRVCKKIGSHSSMIKYGVRHYAHAACGLEKWGAQFFDRLRPWQVIRFPYFPAERAGFGPELIRRVEQAQKEIAE